MMALSTARSIASLPSRIMMKNRHVVALCRDLFERFIMASWVIGVLAAIANGIGCSVGSLAGARQDRPC